MILGVADGAFAQCRPVAERTRDVGCWILGQQPLGVLSESSVFWHLDTYASRADAEAVKGARGTVFEALGKVWLSSIGPENWRPPGGVRVALIGPLTVKGGREYVAQYMEAIFAPGMTTEPHYHPGPEALYTEAGASCFEMPHGTVIGRAGEGTVMAAGHPHTLTAIGTEQRRSLALVIHEPSWPWRIPATDWKPAGRCT